LGCGNQLRVFAEAQAAGATCQEALKAVVDWLVAETARGVEDAAAEAAA
jgi:hypothetical protein